MIRQWLGETVYTILRQKTIKKAILEAKNNGQDFDFETVIEAGEGQLKKWIQQPLSALAFNFDIPHSLKTHLYDLSFPSPITYAAFQGDINQLDMWLRLGIGGGAFKTVLKHKRKGNERPRITSLLLNNEEHLINAYGLPGPGVKDFCAFIQATQLWQYSRPLGISIGGHDPEEYCDVFTSINEVMTEINAPFYYEINISCPNTDEGQNILKEPRLLEKILQTIRSYSDTVCMIKLSPDQSDKDLQIFAEIVTSFEKMGLTLGNTQYKTSPHIKKGGGGLSGPLLFSRTLEMVKLLREFHLPIIATGGIDSSKKVMTCLQNGARCVGLATALVKNPYIIPKINKELKKCL